MAREPVTWSSKCQATVTLSTVEAEYVAMSRCAQQMVLMHNWLDEVEVDYFVPGLIRGDNWGAIALIKTTKDHGKVKHIDIWHHYIQELLQSKAIVVKQVSLADKLADLFTNLFHATITIISYVSVEHYSIHGRVLNYVQSQLLISNTSYFVSLSLYSSFHYLLVTI